MFKKLAKNSKTMKHFFIPTILMLILLTAFGCGNYDNVLSPDESDSGILAAPSCETKIHHGEGWVGPEGNTIHVHGNTNIIVPEGALDDKVYITADVEVYKAESKIHFIFGPHGTVFNKPVRLEISWSYLEDYEGPLELWYLDDGKWVLVEDAIIEKTESHCIIYVDHFSEYYFPRR